MLEYEEKAWKESKKIRVLHVVGAMNRAGTETMLMNIFRNIDRSKVQFDFVSYSSQPAHYDEEIERLGGRVFRLKGTQSIMKLVSLIKVYGPYDVVHSHTLFHCGVANLAARLAGVNVRIAHAHTTSDYSGSLLRKLYLTSMRWATTRFSTHLLACSKQAGTFLYGTTSLDSPKYNFFPNLIDHTEFLNDKQNEVRKFKTEYDMHNKFVIGHIGRFIEPKNHRFILQILKAILKKEREVILLLVGDGDLRLEIEEAAKKEKLIENIRFVGVREDIGVMLQAMDVFVFPSIYEGLGLVLLEAQASGLPCVVSEAIQPEADINLGLFTRLSVNDKHELWADKVLERLNRNEETMPDIPQAFERSGYSLSTGIDRLIGIYQGHRQWREI